MSAYQRLAILIVLASVTTWLGIDSIEAVSQQFPLADSDNIFFIGKQALYFYLWLPVVIALSAIFILGPGLQISLINSKQGDTFAGWILKGFAFSLPILFLGTAIVQTLILGATLTSENFYWLVLIFNVLMFCLVCWLDRQSKVYWAIFKHRLFDACIIIITPLVILILLSAKFYWENFNGDGAHALLSALLMINEIVPFWSDAAGSIASYPSMTTMLEVFVNSFFVRLFGAYELSIRISFLAGLSLLFAVILEFIRFDDDDKDIKTPAFCIALALVLYSFTLAYNASYDFYFADITLPLAREPFIVLAFLGFAYFFMTAQFRWMGVYAFLTYIAVPSGLALMAAWLAAVALIWRPVPVRTLIIAAVSMVVVLAIGKGIPALLASLDLISGKDEFSAGNLLARLRYVTFTDWIRFAYWALPTGIAPAIAVLIWGWQDRIAKTFALVTLGYVALFYVQGYRVLLHHFAPAMILSLIVFWRLKPVQYPNGMRIAAIASIIGVLLAAWISWPPTLQIHTYSRKFAESIYIADPESRQFDGRKIYIFHELLHNAFPLSWTKEDSEKLYSFSPLSWYIYASAIQTPNQNTSYIVEKATSANPKKGSVISQFGDYQLLALNTEKYQADILNPGIERSINDIYFTPHIFFRQRRTMGRKTGF